MPINWNILFGTSEIQNIPTLTLGLKHENSDFPKELREESIEVRENITLFLLLLSDFGSHVLLVQARVNFSPSHPSSGSRSGILAHWGLTGASQAAAGVGKMAPSSVLCLKPQ